MPRPRPPKPCPKCDAPVLWWHNPNRPGRMIGVDLSSDQDTGTVQKSISETADETKVFGHVLSGGALADAIASGTMLFTLHSKTCSATKPFNPRPAGLTVTLPNRKQPRR